MTDQPAEPRPSLVHVITRTLALGGVWLVLVEADVRHHPVLAGLSILGASALAIGVGVGAHPRLHVGGVLRFIPFFLRISLSGGVDVAVRVFRRRALDPGLIRYEQRLASGSAAQVFFAALVSVVPGTLCASIGERALTIHVIDRGKDPRKFIAKLEQRVAAMFGQTIAASTPGGA